MQSRACINYKFDGSILFSTLTLSMKNNTSQPNKEY